MKKCDKKIKDALILKMEKIDNPSFTKTIVSKHLSKKDEQTRYVQFDFVSLIAALIFVIISLGLSILITTEKIIGLTFEHLLVSISLAVIFLIFRLLNEITTPNKSYM